MVSPAFKYTYALWRAERVPNPRLVRIAFLFRRQIHDTDGARIDIVNFFDGAGDLRFRRALRHFKGVHALLGYNERLLGEPRRTNNLVGNAIRELRGARVMHVRDFFAFCLSFFFLIAK